MASPRSIARAAARGNRRSGNRTRNIRTITGRVYLASPLSTYRTARYARMIESARTHFPKADILPARDLFSGNADWRRRWPDILPTLDALVFFDDDDGYIGAGTEREITDAWRVGIPVYFIPRPPFDIPILCDGTGDVTFQPIAGRGMKQTLLVSAAIPAATVLEKMRPGPVSGGET